MTRVMVYMAFSVMCVLFTTDSAHDILADMVKLSQKAKDWAKHENQSQVIFIHWGSQQCSGNSKTIYKGFVAVAQYGQSAAANYLCLSEEERHGTIDNNSNAHLYGVEYRNPRSHQLSSAFCAVCSIATASELEILNYSTECQPGWDKQYDGYQMKGVGAFHLPIATGSFCVDTKMDGKEMYPGPGQVGGKLTFVDHYCHGGQCNDYARCVVCSL